MRNILSVVLLVLAALVLLLPYLPPAFAGQLVYLGYAALGIIAANLLGALLRHRWWQLAHTTALLLSLPLLGAYVPVIPREAKAGTTPLRILSCNVDNFLVSPDTMRRSTHHMQTLQPDVICLQERPHDVKVAWADTRATLPRHPYAVRNSHEDEVLNLAILSRHPIIAHGERTFHGTYNKYLWADVVIHTDTHHTDTHHADTHHADTLRIFSVHLQTTGITPTTLATTLHNATLQDATLHDATLHDATLPEGYVGTQHAASATSRNAARMPANHIYAASDSPSKIEGVARRAGGVCQPAIMPAFNAILRNAQFRDQQALQLLRDIQQSPHPVIVCGDFNDTPSGYPARLLRRHLTDVSRRPPLCGTFKRWGNILKIDYILCTPTLQPLGYQTADTPWTDHKLQLATIAI